MGSNDGADRVRSLIGENRLGGPTHQGHGSVSAKTGVQRPEGILSTRYASCVVVGIRGDYVCETSIEQVPRGSLGRSTKSPRQTRARDLNQSSSGRSVTRQRGLSLDVGIALRMGEQDPEALRPQVSNQVR